MTTADKPAGTPHPPQIDAEEMKRRTIQSREIAASLGQLVSLMIQSRHHRLTMLSELEWMLLPAVTTRQFRVAEGFSQERGIVAPVGAVLWANVNPETDRRLAENLDLPIRLRPQEWRSGDHTWIIETLGEANAVNAMLQHLMQNELKGRTVRIRVAGKDGKPTIGRVELQPDGK